MKPTKPSLSSPNRQYPNRRPCFIKRANKQIRGCSGAAPRNNTTTLRTLPGFTLTELLVVIGIIAVLALLIFSIAKNIRDKAKSSTCVQNLRQIGIALTSHITENNGRFPNGSADVSWLKDSNNNNLGLCWYDAAAANMGREKYSQRFNDPDADPLPDVFSCPSGRRKAAHPAWPYTGDYAANRFLGDPSNPNNPLTMATLKHPESTPYVQDTVNQNQFTQAIYNAGFSKTANAAFAARHGGRGNILWVDGHVSSLTYEEYMEFANDPKHGGPGNFIRGNW
jgi:prepilin-type processing-associated H-X9-DG protein/prepilin-type N-terminal cleavage/methylation domain-containing protein